MARERDLATRPGGMFWRLVVRSLAKNRVRTAVSLCGIVLACGLATAVLTTLTSLNHSLFLRTAEREGAWCVWGGAVSDAAVQDLLSTDVTAVSRSYELGSALLDSTARDDVLYGALTVREMPSALKGTQEQAAALTKLPVVAEGRLPQAPDEILLPLRMKGLELVAGEELPQLKPDDKGNPSQNADAKSSPRDSPSFEGVSGAASDGPLAVGSTITLDLGTRVFADEEGNHPTYAGDWRFFGDEDEGGWAPQHVEDVQRLAYTVVGFRRPQDDEPGVNLIASLTSIVAVTGAGGAERLQGLPTAQAVWADAAGYTSYDAFHADMNVFFEQDSEPATRVQQPDLKEHYTLLRYQGLTPERPLYEGVEVIAAVLLAVIVAAGISLVYTSFAISVNERTRQLGLLASLGASAKQLRHLVVLEALLLGAVGIPLGMACGVAGVALVLRMTSEGFSYLLDTGGGLELHVDARVMAVVLVASAAVVLLSAWVPAWRAGRTSAVEAIRQLRDVRVGRQARKEIARLARGGRLALSPARLPSLAGRLAGVPGFVAHRNLSRASARGRAVALSLGVSFALLVTSGIIGQYLSPVDDIAASRGAQAEGNVMVAISRGQSLDAAGQRGLAHEVARRIDGLAGVQVDGIEHGASLQVRVPAAMVAEELRSALKAKDDTLLEQEYGGVEPTDGAGLYLNEARFLPSGDYVGYARCEVVDEATWQRLCAEVGADATASDAVLAVNVYRTEVYDPDDETYRTKLVDAFAHMGDIEAISLHEDRIADRFGVQGYPVIWGSVLAVRNGELGLAAEVSTNADDEAGSVAWLPLLPDDVSERSLRVVGLTKHLTNRLSWFGGVTEFPTFVVPERVLDAHEDLAASSWDSCISVKAQDPTRATQRLEELMSNVQGDFEYEVRDLGADVRQARAMRWTLMLFVRLFAGVTMLIAVFNAFNTLSNSVALRAREFAALRSMGMGPAAFERMMACECASYALRGLALGSVLVLLINLGLWYGMDLALSDVRFAIPWTSLVGATLGVVAVTGLTVWYALRRSGAMSVVDALHSDVS